MDDKKISKEKYKELISGVQIQSIRLKSLFVSDVNLTEKRDLAVELIYSCDDFEKANNQIQFYPLFQIRIKELEKDDVLADINFKFEVNYLVQSLNAYSEEYIELFKEKNLPVNIWPYARELVSSLTTRIGYPTLILEPYKQG